MIFTIIIMITEAVEELKKYPLLDAVWLWFNWMGIVVSDGFFEVIVDFSFKKAVLIFVLTICTFNA